MLADWIAPKVQKSKKGARVLVKNVCLAKSFTMHWSSAIPIQVSEHNDTVWHPLHLTQFICANWFVIIIIFSYQCHYSVICFLQGQLAGVYSEVLTFLSCHGKWLAECVTIVFLSLLLILAGDVEVNPGPGKGKEKSASS